MDSFDEETINRYEAFRRAHLPKTQVRKVLTSLVGPVPQSSAIVVAGVAKIFVGEICEEALQVQEEWGESGPLKPTHLRESFRRYQKSHNMINKKYNRNLFTR